MLPASLQEALRVQVRASRELWDKDRQCGRAGVDMPYALDSKYPNAGRSWPWFWVFPSPTLSVDSRTNVEGRHHLYEQRVGRAIACWISRPAPP